MTIGLNHGEPSAAALTVAEALGPLQTILSELGDRVEAAAPGFRGGAAAGLGQALSAWFQVAGTLAPILEAYGQALSTVDLEHAVNEGRQLDHYAELSQRLGGPR